MNGRGPICLTGSRRVGSIRRTQRTDRRIQESLEKANGTRTAPYKRAYYEHNREEVIARSKEWLENNVEKVKRFKANNSRKRRAAKHASRGNFTAKEFQQLCGRYGNKCLRCGSTGVVLEADHIVPLTSGGSDDINNIQPLCGACNRSKFVKIIDYRASEHALPKPQDLR
jgi:5-methylcytosine-specific restriction protein A